MRRGFYSCRPWLSALATVILSALSAAGASAGCPDVSASYSAKLGLSVSKGIKSADSACVEGAPTGGACNSFVGMVIDKTYGFPDLKTNGGYLDAAGIYAFLPTSAAWTAMGFAGEQTVLNQVQMDANNGVPVIAISSDQVALIIPSLVLVHTETWNLCVPMSAAHFLNDPSANYVSGPLSLSWPSTHGVTIWERTGPPNGRYLPMLTVLGYR